MAASAASGNAAAQPRAGSRGPEAVVLRSGYLSATNFRCECHVNRKPETDIASTDMSSEPSSRDEATQARFEAEGGADEPGPGADAVGSAVEREMQELKERHLRLAAEFDNYKKRVARERTELSDRAQATFILRLLDVLDDLDRLSAEGTARSPEALREAVVMIDRKLRKELEGAGVERVDPVGLPFNPAEHEAVSVIPAPDPLQAHMVSATFQTGYLFKGTLVRPARVQVYSEPSPA